MTPMSIELGSTSSRFSSARLFPYTVICVFCLGLGVRGPAWSAGPTPVGPEFQVNTFTTANQTSPAVAIGGNGNIVVVWEGESDQDGDLIGIFGQRYDGTGAPLGGEFQINTYTTGNQLEPEIASAADGSFVVVWRSFHDGDQDGLFGQRYDGAGSPQGAEFQVNAYTTGSQNFQAVAADADGNFVVAWQEYGRDGDSNGIFARRFSSTGTPFGSDFQVNAYTTSFQQVPAVAADAAGNFVVAWQSQYQDGEVSGIFARLYSSAGVPQGDDFQVNTYTTGSQSFVAVAADADGKFVVAWDSFRDGSSSGVFAQRFASSGTPVGGEFQVNTYTTGFQGTAKIAAAPSGAFVVAWRSVGQDGDGAGLFARRFTAWGTPQGDDFQVNSYTTGAQQIHAVASAPDGDFTVVWRSFGQDGSQHGVFAQRFAAPASVPTASLIALVLLTTLLLAAAGWRYRGRASSGQRS